MKIKQAETPIEIDEVRRLFREYEAFLGVDLCFQSFEEELAGLPGEYTSPRGALMIGMVQDKVVGCVAIRELDDDACEMKRLFVRPEARGLGLGKLLAHEAVKVAHELGYALMRLDTLDHLKKAMRLYECLGFRKTEPYYENPLPRVVYWKLDLRKKWAGQ